MTVVIVLLCVCSCGVSKEKKQSVESGTKQSHDKYLNEVAGQGLKIPEKIKDVVANDEKFLWTETDKKLFLKEFDSDKIEEFCVNDLDGDGVAELLLQLESSNILILHLEDKTVYGYTVPFRGMLDLKTDGSYGVSGGAAVYSIETINFNGEEYSFTELCYYDGIEEENNVIYRLNGETASKEEVTEYLQRQDEKENAVWYLFNENLELITRDVQESVSVDRNQKNRGNILKGCEEFLYIRGKELLELDNREGIFTISNNIKLGILIKRGSPNGMDIYISDTDGNFLYNLMHSEEIDTSITDQWGMPLEELNYEVAVYDLNSDSKKEIIFLAGSETKIWGYIFEVDAKEEKVNFKFIKSFTEENGDFVEVEKIYN